MAENAAKQLRASQGICERQMTLRGVVIEFPHELGGERPVIVLFHLGVKLLHPTEFEEELGEVPLCFLKYPLLHTVPELVIAVLPPEFIYGFEVSFRDKLDLGEEDIATLLSSVAGEDDDEAAGLFVGLAEVRGGEVVAEEVEGDGLRRGSGGGGEGGDREGEGGGGGRGRGERGVRVEGDGFGKEREGENGGGMAAVGKRMVVVRVADGGEGIGGSHAM